MKIKKVFAILNIILLPNLYASNLDDFVLPKDVKKFEDNLGGSKGAVYISPTEKNKALMPINLWGEINRAGLHYIPTNSKLINGLSLAGGPGGQADLSKVSLIRKNSVGKIESYKFDLESDNIEVQDFALRAGDTVYIAKDTFDLNRAYYTSLVGVIATVLSSILIYREVKK